MGEGRLLTIGVKLSFKLCTWVGHGESCLMGGGPDFSITLLPLSSLTYSKELSISFAYYCFSSLGNWFVCFAIVFLLNTVRLCYDFL